MSIINIKPKGITFKTTIPKGLVFRGRATTFQIGITYEQVGVTYEDSRYTYNDQQNNQTSSIIPKINGIKTL